jgi:hypothetical protein
VTSIGGYAFCGCTNLIVAKFLGNAPSMGDYVFEGSFRIFKVYYISDKTGFTNPWYGYTTTTDTYVLPTFTDINDSWGEPYINDLASM